MSPSRGKDRPRSSRTDRTSSAWDEGDRLGTRECGAPGCANKATRIYRRHRRVRGGLGSVVLRYRCEEHELPGPYAVAEQPSLGLGGA